MRKYIILLSAAISLIGAGIILTLSVRSVSAWNFTNPIGYKELVTLDLDKKDRFNEVVYTATVGKPKRVEFFIQTDSTSDKEVKILSDKTLLGMKSNEWTLLRGAYRLVNNSNATPIIFVDKGKYDISVTSKKSVGKIKIYYRESSLEASDQERLLKIGNGNLDNPPAGYLKICTINLSDNNCKDKTIYSFSNDKFQEIGFCVYSNSQKGNFNVRINKDSWWLGSPGYTCDKFVRPFEKGDYRITLANEGADGELYVYMKK